MIRGWPLRQAVRALRHGGLIAYPTEAVYGLGCNPLDAGAVFNLLDLKQRPIHKGLILIAHRFEVLEPWLQPISKKSEKTALSTWPGPNTWLWPAQEWVPRWVRGEHLTVAVRVTAHPVAAKLCQAWGGPIISTSANPSTLPPARTAFKCQQYFGNQLDAVVHGATEGADKPTTIRDIVSGEIVRPG